MDDRNKPLYRMPCEQKAGKPVYFYGGLFQHSIAPQLIDRYVNTTVVPNPNTDVGGTVPPYERWTPDVSGGDSCEIHHCVIDPEAAPCSQWLRPFIANSFSHTPGDQVSFAVARKTGFKNVQVRRFWSGRFGYLHKESGDGPDTTQNCDGHDAFKKWRGYTPAVADTKYLTLTVSAESQEQQYPGPMVNWDDKASYSQSIDPNSGLLTVDSLSVTPNDDRNRALSEIFRGAWFWGDIVGDMVRNLRSPFTPYGHVDGTDTSITVWEDDGSN
ncbi:MAG TPA: hypothetical protein VGI88_07685, partial [Verrucomicrobiae bacterium]